MSYHLVTAIDNAGYEGITTHLYLHVYYVVTLFNLVKFVQCVSLCSVQARSVVHRIAVQCIHLPKINVLAQTDR